MKIHSEKYKIGEIQNVMLKWLLMPLSVPGDNIYSHSLSFLIFSVQVKTRLEMKIIIFGSIYNSLEF